MSSPEYTLAEARSELYELMGEDLSFETKAERALELGRAYLDVENGHLTRIDSQTNHWETIASTDGTGGQFPSGLTLDLDKTYCRRVIDGFESIALHDAPHQGWGEDPAFKTHGLHCYHGAKITFGDNGLGTLCFVSTNPRDAPFEDAETLFVEHIARLLEREIQQSQHQAELTKRANVITVLNRVLRHNLRNDITIIRGWVTQIADQFDVDTTVMETILDEIDGLVRLTEKVRELEAILTTDAEREQYDVAKLVNEAVTGIKSDYDQGTVTVDAPEDVYVNVRPNVERALHELLENALTHAGPDPDVGISIELPPNAVRIHVSDDGPGLPEQEREALDTGVELPLVHSSGIGLWLVYWIIADHGGSIDTTVSNDGTTVTMELPRATTPDGAANTTTTEVLELRESRDRFRAVFENAFDAMLIANDDGHYLDANERAAEMFGLPREDLLGRSIEAFAIEEFDFEAAWSEFLDGDSMTGEFTIARPDGEERIVEYSATSDIVPGQHLTVLRDITDRREHERRYRAIFDQTFQYTGLMEPDGTLVEANQSALDFGGLDREDVVGEKIWETHWFQVSEETREQVRADVRRAADGEFVRHEMEVQGTDGTVVLDFSIRPVTDEHETVDMLIPEGRDITQLKNQHDELERKNERLEQFASIVSHDLRNPLNIARGNLEEVQGQFDSPLLDEVEYGLDRIDELIEELLVLAREGNDVGDVEQVSLADVVTEAWRVIDAPEATLEVEVTGTVEANETSLSQLFENLLANAVEHGGDDVTITIGDLPNGFYVEDTGAGIAPDQREAVLEAGYSGNAGTGLGLSIVADIVASHGWNLTVTATEQGGARFKLSGLSRS